MRDHTHRWDQPLEHQKSQPLRKLHILLERVKIQESSCSCRTWHTAGARGWLQRKINYHKYSGRVTSDIRCVVIICKMAPVSSQWKTLMPINNATFKSLSQDFGIDAHSCWVFNSNSHDARNSYKHILLNKTQVSGQCKREPENSPYQRASVAGKLHKDEYLTSHRALAFLPKALELRKNVQRISRVKGERTYTLIARL